MKREDRYCCSLPGASDIRSPRSLESWYRKLVGPHEYAWIGYIVEVLECES